MEWAVHQSTHTFSNMMAQIAIAPSLDRNYKLSKYNLNRICKKQLFMNDGTQTVVTS